MNLIFYCMSNVFNILRVQFAYDDALAVSYNHKMLIRFYYIAIIINIYTSNLQL